MPVAILKERVMKISQSNLSVNLSINTGRQLPVLSTWIIISVICEKNYVHFINDQYLVKINFFAI